MRRERKIVGRYYRLSPKKRMDLIITNYDCFPAMCKDYERELSEWLKDSKEKARRLLLVTWALEYRAAKAVLQNRCHECDATGGHHYPGCIEK